MGHHHHRHLRHTRPVQQRLLHTPRRQTAAARPVLIQLFPKSVLMIRASSYVLGRASLEVTSGPSARFVSSGVISNTLIATSTNDACAICRRGERSSRAAVMDATLERQTAAAVGWFQTPRASENHLRPHRRSHWHLQTDAACRVMGLTRNTLKAIHVWSQCVGLVRSNHLE